MRLVLSDRALTSVPVGRDFEYVDLSALKIAPPAWGASAAGPALPEGVSYVTMPYGYIP